MATPVSVERPGVLVLRRHATREVVNVINFCQNCGDKRSEHIKFWVHDSVWKEAGNPDGVFCLFCLTRRLHRPLTEADFTTEGFGPLETGYEPVSYKIPKASYLMYSNKAVAREVNNEPLATPKKPRPIRLAVVCPECGFNEAEDPRMCKGCLSHTVECEACFDCRQECPDNPSAIFQ